jgi:hypothetical protein
MAKVKVNAGACGLQTTIEVKPGLKGFKVKVLSECPMAAKLGYDLPELKMMDAFKKILDNPVYRTGSMCLKHISCPVPCAVLKCLEAEAGLAVMKDVVISFEREPEKKIKTE